MEYKNADKKKRENAKICTKKICLSKACAEMIGGHIQHGRLLEVSTLSNEQRTT